MFSFRQKIVVSYIGLYLLFILLMFGTVRLSVGVVVRRAMSDRAHDLMRDIKSSASVEAALAKLRDMERSYFFRVGLFDQEGCLLFDSKRLDTPFACSRRGDNIPPEVETALRGSLGYAEDYSTYFQQRFAYTAEAFPFAGETYVLRLAFPLKPIESMTRDFELGFLVLISLVLLTFTLVNWSVIYHFTKPVQRILKAIAPFQQGLTDRLPYLPIAMEGEYSDVERLADTLNQLNERVQMQIQAILRDRNERAALLESLFEGVLAVDHGGAVTYANPAAWRLLGIRSAPRFPALIGSVASQKPPLLDRVEEVIQSVVVTKTLIETSYQSDSPRFQVIDIVACPVRGGYGSLVVLHDVTSRAQVLRVGRDFVANASHELRTPITIIKGFAETLQEHPDLPEAQRVTIVDKMVRNCSRMEHLVGSLLLLADVDHSVAEDCGEVDVVQVASDCREHLVQLYPEVKIELTESGGVCRVWATADLLSLALFNLLSNAVKYCKRKPEILLHLHATADQVYISVQDNGIGIPEGDLPHIFDRFFTVDKARSRSMGGAGLGLALVRSIVERFGGTVQVESTLDEGSTFTLVFPISGPGLEEVAPGPHSTL